MARLLLDNVNKTYFGGYVGAKNVSFGLGGGETLAILGKSMSGKTTLLKLIATLETPSVGSITIDGRDVSTISTRDINITYASSDLGLFMTKSTRYNLAYPLTIRKVDKALIDERTRTIARLFDIESIMDEHVRYLSRSLIARVILARAFMRESDFYLFDNVLGDFSLSDREMALEVLSRVLPMVKGGVIYATDRVEELALVGGDNVLVLSGGEIMDMGRISELYRHADSLETLRLLSKGTLNEIVTRVSRDDNGYYIDALGKHYIEIDEVYLDKDIIIAFRMDDIHLCDDGVMGIVTKVYRSTVYDVARVVVGDIEILQSTDTLALNEGMDVHLVVSHMDLFDVRSERRIIGAQIR